MRQAAKEKYQNGKEHGKGNNRTERGICSGNDGKRQFCDYPQAYQGRERQTACNERRAALFFVLRGRAVEVDFSPKDKGGYQPLDLVFDVSPKAELFITKVVQEMNGVKQRRTVYTVNTVDEDGIVWKAEVKPSRTSDRDMLAMLINLIGAWVETVDDTTDGAAA